MRATATIGSFFLILGLYFLYGWVAVPLVLPNSEEAKPGDTVQHDDMTRDEVKPFLSVFPEDSWERNPDIDIHYLKFHETILLFGKDESNGNFVKLQPCTVMMVPGIDDPELDEQQINDRIRQAVILRTPTYAEIEFNREFNLSQLPLPDIVGGKLHGKVAIRSDRKDPGPGDDLDLETEDVSISMTNPAVTKITTIKDVRFRIGYHGGEGSMLSLELTASNPADSKSEKELSRVLFEKLKRLDLVFPDDPEAPAKIVADNAPGVIRQQRVIPACPATYLNVKCQRQFSFFSQKSDRSWIARFLGNVEMTRITPDGLTDLLTADEVLIDFKEKTVLPERNRRTQAVKKTDKREQPSSGNVLARLEPVRFKAQGRLAQNNRPPVPARLESRRSGGIVAMGDQLLYDAKRNYLAIETQTVQGASPEVELVLENRYHIRGQKGFEYTMGVDDDFGRLVSMGKGTLSGNFGDAKTPKNLFLSWDQMQIAPDPENREQIIVKLWGGIAANLEGFGKMTAGKLDLWCRKTVNEPSDSSPRQKPQQHNSPGTLPGLGDEKGFASGKGGLTPVVAVVSDKVRFENESGTCDAKRMEVTFASTGDTDAALLRTRPRPPELYVSGSTSNHRSEGNIVTADGTRTSSRDAIRLVQHLQQPEVRNQIRSTVLATRQEFPLYEARPNPPTGSQSRSIHPITPASPAPTSVATQNLLGLQSGTKPARYEITGDVIRMRIDNDGNGNSLVETMKIEGNVRVLETVLDATRGDLVEVLGEEVRVWNPSTSETQILIVGNPMQNAEFKGRGVRMLAKEINISKPENKIWSRGMGRLIINSDRTDGAIQGLSAPKTGDSHVLPGASALTPLKPVAPADSGGPLVVEWNDIMLFDGKTIIFRGVPDRNGNRVRTVFQDKSIWCNVMEIHLNRLVHFFEKNDDSKIAPEADTIRCLHEVYVLIREKDDYGQLKAINEAHFDTFSYQVKTNYFVATALGQGSLRRTFLGSGKGFTDSKFLQGGAASSSPEKQDAGSDEKLTFLSVWFQQDILGMLRKDHLDVEINGRVQTVYCPVESWDDVIGIENIKAARRLGYILECEKLRIVQMPDPLNPSRGAVELTAQENAVIDGSKFYGQAKMIKFNQAKSLVVFDGNAKLHTFDGGKRLENSAEAYEYNLETGGFNIRQSSGTIIGP